MFFCRLRSAYPHCDRSKNAGFVWSPSVGLEELHQGLGVSVKVTVISEHFREPLTFTCDGKTRSCWSVAVTHNRRRVLTGVTPASVLSGSSTVDLLIYQTLCYAQDELHHLDVDDYLLKVCGHDEFLHK